MTGCLLLSPAFAGVRNTDHDMFASGRGTDPNVCSYCHVPHNAAGDKIWSTWGNEAQLQNDRYTPIARMCYTCHDGTITDKGLGRIFNTNLQQHKLPPGKDCNMCHSVHDQSHDEFMKMEPVGTPGKTRARTWCEACHSGATMDPDAAHLGDHLQGSNHPYQGDGWMVRSCWACHVEHGAAPYTPSTGPITHPILSIEGINSRLVINDDSSLCEACHADFVQNPTGNKHPANMSAAGTWGKLSCQTCHDVHQPDHPGRPAILKEQNVDSSLCTSCHADAEESRGPRIGHGHPVNVPLSVVPVDPNKAPVGNAIDDDNKNGPDYPDNSDNMICETCHSPHLKGEAAPALRTSPWCLNCHPLHGG